MALAKDIMTMKPLVIGSGMTVDEVSELFLAHHISSAPVQTPLGEVIGVLSETELIRALVQTKANTEKEDKIIHFKEALDPAFFVSEDDPIALVLRQMLRSGTHRVLVKDKHKRLVGIISPKDILLHLNGDEKISQTLMEELRALHDEVQKLRDQLKDMSSYLEIYDSIFHTGIYMLHSADKDGRILIANERLHQALGYADGELVGKTIYDIYPQTVHQEVAAGLRRVLAEGKHQLIYSSMRKKNGDVIRVEIASAALKDSSGHFVGTFTISREIGSEALLRSLHGIFDDPEKAKSLAPGTTTGDNQ